MSRISVVLFFLAGLIFVGSVVSAVVFSSAALVLCMYLALPLYFVGLGMLDNNTYGSKKSIDSGFRATKITTGRFKGQMLLSEYDAEQIEREVLDESVEAMLERVCKEVPKPTASSLAESTIRRLDEQLDPRCGCSLFNDHRKSGHDRYVQDQKAINEANARRDHERQKETQIVSHIDIQRKRQRVYDDNHALLEQIKRYEKMLGMY